MSTESSASETTPLRRPESSLSSEIPPSSQSERLLPHPNDRRHCQINLGRGLIPNSFQQNLTPNNENSVSNYSRESDKQMMETNKKIIYRVAIDVVVLLCVGFPILIFFLIGTPYKRGFFCDDESLKHPFHDSTVTNWMLYIIGLVIPIGTILIVEILRYNYETTRSNGNNIRRQYVFGGYEIPYWLVECYKKIGVFGFGAAASQLITDVAKYSIGRLRPHFFNVCQPVMPDGTTCNDPVNMGKYILDFKCQGIGSSEKMLKEVRLSFPSGHSSFTFYTMVYIALYLQARWHWKGSKLLRHAIQFCLILIAWFTALSRVSDYKHHWSDVLAGVIIGVIVAIVVARYVSDLFVDKPAKTYMLPKTQQDLNQQTYTTNGQG